MSFLYGTTKTTLRILLEGIENGVNYILETCHLNGEKQFMMEALFFTFVVSIIIVTLTTKYKQKEYVRARITNISPAIIMTLLCRLAGIICNNAKLIFLNEKEATDSSTMVEAFYLFSFIIFLAYFIQQCNFIRNFHVIDLILGMSFIYLDSLTSQEIIYKLSADGYLFKIKNYFIVFFFLLAIYYSILILIYILKFLKNTFRSESNAYYKKISYYNWIKKDTNGCLSDNLFRNDT